MKSLHIIAIYLCVVLVSEPLPIFVCISLIKELRWTFFLFRRQILVANTEAAKKGKKKKTARLDEGDYSFNLTQLADLNMVKVSRNN